MSKERFIKFIPSEESLQLARNHPNAFVLLMFIAERARRESGYSDGLEKGMAKIGDWENMGLSRQNYRTALKTLIVKKFLQILETNRTRKKSTTGSTTEGTLVRLLDSRIWDINIEQPNHSSNHCLTTAQPLPNHEQERKRKKKKEKEEHNPRAAPLLAEFFASLSFVIPNFSEDKMRHTQAQLTAMDHLLSIHGEEKVRSVFFYAHQNEFWRAHVHTAIYLKQKFETLISQMQSKTPNKTVPMYREKILDHFKHGEIYNGAECNIGGDLISFTRGMTHAELKFNVFGFDDQLRNLLNRFGIAIPLNSNGNGAPIDQRI